MANSLARRACICGTCVHEIEDDLEAESQFTTGSRRRLRMQARLTGWRVVLVLVGPSTTPLDGHRTNLPTGVYSRHVYNSPDLASW